MENINWMSYMHDLDKNPEYEKYLTEHINAVQNASGWLKLHLPELLDVYNFSHETAYYGELDEIIAKHDQSKYRKIPDADNYYELPAVYCGKTESEIVEINGVSRKASAEFTLEKLESLLKNKDCANCPVVSISPAVEYFPVSEPRYLP